MTDINQSSWGFTLAPNEPNGLTIPIRIKQHYTISFVAYSLMDNSPLQIGFSTRDFTDLTKEHLIMISKEPQRYSLSIDYQDDDLLEKDTILKFWHKIDDNVISIFDIQVEEGNVMTAYSPHNDQFVDVDNVINEIKTDIENINVELSNLYSSYRNVDNVINEIKTDIENINVELSNLKTYSSYRNELYRPQFHLSPLKHWSNDPQRPFYYNGKWHFYYLFDWDYNYGKGGNGTAWRHATSTDLVHWKDEGVAIPKWTIPNLGDVWTGSSVIDVNNTAGFGQNAIISIVTQPYQGYQAQTLWYSTDGGNNFTYYNVVMPNPTNTSEPFRDPKVIWHDESNKWILLLAELNKIGFYSSDNLKTWTYVGAFERSDLGTLECPDLFKINLDGDTNNTKWVLGCGGNGFQYNLSTGYYYWVGNFDGTNFVADSSDFGVLDYGFDNYAGVTFADTLASNKFDHRYYIGWMNNWAYAKAIPTRTFNGIYTCIRKLKLKTVNAKPTLVHELVDLTSITKEKKIYNDQMILSGTRIISDIKSKSFILDLDINTSLTQGKCLFTFLDDNGSHKTTVDYNPTNNTVSLSRDICGFNTLIEPGTNADKSSEFNKNIFVNTQPVNGHLTMKIIVDVCTVEVLINNGEKSISCLTFPLSDGAESMSLWNDGGDIFIHSAELSLMNSIYTNTENTSSWDLN